MITGHRGCVKDGLPEESPPVLPIDQPNIPIINGNNKLWRCKDGHSYRSPVPVRMTMGPISSGPMCPMCYLTWVGQSFPVEEVKEDGEAKLITP